VDEAADLHDSPSERLRQEAIEKMKKTRLVLCFRNIDALPQVSKPS
jgi:hypothetical protein